MSKVVGWLFFGIGLIAALLTMVNLIINDASTYNWLAFAVSLLILIIGVIILGSVKSTNLTPTQAARQKVVANLNIRSRQNLVTNRDVRPREKNEEYYGSLDD